MFADANPNIVVEQHILYRSPQEASKGKSTYLLIPFYFLSLANISTSISDNLREISEELGKGALSPNEDFFGNHSE